MGFLKSLMIAGLAMVALSAPGTAKALVYDEAVSGDVPSNLALDLGTNVIFGTVSCLPSCDFDLFNATVPTGAILDSIELTMIEGDGGNGTSPLRLQALESGGGTILSAPLTGFGSYSFTLGVPTSGLVSVGLNSFPGGMDVDYRLTINLSSVSQIPLPAAGLLYVGALILGGAAWRRHRVA